MVLLPEYTSDPEAIITQMLESEDAGLVDSDSELEIGEEVLDDYLLLIEEDLRPEINMEGFEAMIKSAMDIYYE